MRILNYLLLMLFTLAIFSFIAGIENNLPVGGKFGIPALVAQQVAANGDTFETL